MKINWTKGLEGKDKQDMENSVRGSTIALNRLEKLVGEFKSEIDTTLPADFETPQWALKRAYRDGQIYAFNRILTLLKD